MTTIDESTIVTRPTCESSENNTARPEAQAWQLGILTDRAGHVHLGAVVAGTAGEPSAYIDLLAPLGASRVGDIDLAHWSSLSEGSTSTTCVGLPNAVSMMHGSDDSSYSLSSWRHHDDHQHRGAAARKEPAPLMSGVWPQDRRDGAADGRHHGADLVLPWA
jgi:hypothetical protein